MAKDKANNYIVSNRKSEARIAESDHGIEEERGLTQAKVATSALAIGLWTAFLTAFSVTILQQQLFSTEPGLVVLAAACLAPLGSISLIVVLKRLVLKSQEAIIQSKLEVVHRLALAAEFRDDETGRHNFRIGRYCQILADQLGVDSRQCELMFHAAALHDVGKIGISDTILLKPGRLSASEIAIMRGHVEFGARILAGGKSELLKLAHSIALTHHERWDGTGYPNGLLRYEIPIEGRIVAVADVLDALTSERPYKEAWSFEEAAAEILSKRGSQFDPVVVDALSECLPSLRKVRQEAQEVPWHVFEGQQFPVQIISVDLSERIARAGIEAEAPKFDLQNKLSQDKSAA